jgi:CO/xanthine dehydrogenase FAD-binding subunit
MSGKIRLEHRVSKLIEMLYWQVLFYSQTFGACHLSEFYNARDLREAYDLLSQYGRKALILAGGTDVMVKLNRKLASPKALIHVGGCGLNYVKLRRSDIVIGAATPFAEVASSDLVQKKIPLLAEAVLQIGGPAIRNAGTIGGNLANASPAADSAVPLLALGASLRLASKRGERAVPIEKFFTGPGQTALKPDELLKEVIVPVPEHGTKSAYQKIGRRRANTLSVVAGAIALNLNAKHRCTKARIALGAVAPMPLLAKKASALLEGQQLDADLMERVAKAAVGEANPIDDVRATAWYRRRAISVLVKSLLEELVK